MQYTVLIAGSTSHTTMCAEALFADERFSICGVLTPSPRPIGRKQIITPNPLHQFATEHALPIVHVEKRIDQTVRHQLESTLQLESTPELEQDMQRGSTVQIGSALHSSVTTARPDFLLVVDFGYIVPNWLLELPTTAPVNIHPSKLPQWRGSSPGQFVLLYGEKQSSVSVIIMNDLLDQGALVTQLPFAVQETWTQTEYYSRAFTLVAAKLPSILDDLAQKRITPEPQPLDTPTPIAARFTKEDGFVPWEMVTAAMSGAAWDTLLANGSDAQKQHPEPTTNYLLSPLLDAALAFHGSPAKLIYYASHALSPWPGIWTIVQTVAGEKRMKILTSRLDAELELGSVAGSVTNSATKSAPNATQPAKLILETVQLEGKSPTPWSSVKSLII